MNESTVYTCVTRRVTLVTNPVIIMNESTVYTCVTRRVTLVTNPVISHE
jgi:hypothetical protein